MAPLIVTLSLYWAAVLGAFSSVSMARLSSDSRYCRVEIHKRLDPPYCGATESLVFSEAVPHDYAALRASVSVLARTIAGRERRQ